MKKASAMRLMGIVIMVLIAVASVRSQDTDGGKRQAAWSISTAFIPESVKDQDKTRASTIVRFQPSGEETDDEFIVEPRTYIRLRVDILEIEPSETHSIASPSIRIQNQKSAEITMGSPEESLSIQITPIIKEKKGIELEFAFQKKPEMKDKRLEKAFALNGESVVIELFENKNRNSKISLKVTPLIEVIKPMKEYPGAVHELHLDDSYLLKNDDKLIAHGNLSATTSDDGEICLWFADDEGLFVLGFRRFDGAEPSGFVRGTEIKIKFGDVHYKWVNRNPLLPEGKWIVWVLRYPPRFKNLIEKSSQGILGKNGMIGIAAGKDSWKYATRGWKNMAER